MQTTPSAPQQYDAFISYRRSDGTRAARWLRTRLLSYKLPKILQKQRNPSLEIYLDKIYERATEDFFEKNIKPSLEQSRFLIIVATPDALLPRSDGSPNWVQRETEIFMDLQQGRNVLVALAKGEFGGPLPAQVAERFPQVEIVDIRGLTPLRYLWWPKRWKLREELVKLAAPLFNISIEEMPQLRLEESRRRQRRLWFTIVSTLALFAVMAGLFIWSIVNLAQARQQVVRTYVLQGQSLFAQRPAAGRLYIARGLQMAESSYLLRLIGRLDDLGITRFGYKNDYEKARLWLGVAEGEPKLVGYRSLSSNDWPYSYLGDRFLRFTPGGRYYYTIHYTPEAHELKLWETRTGALVRSSLREPPNEISPGQGLRSIVYDSTRQTNHKLIVMDNETGEVAGDVPDRVVEMGDGNLGVRISEDGKTLISTDKFGKTRFWNAENGKLLGPSGSALPLDESAGKDQALSPNGRISFTRQGNGAPVLAWNNLTGKLLFKIPKSERLFQSGPGVSRVSIQLTSGMVLPGLQVAVFSPDGEWALVAPSDEYLEVLHLRSGKPTGSKIFNTDYYYPWPVFSPDGLRIAVVNAEKRVQIHNFLGQPIGTPIQHQGTIMFVKFSPDGNRILTGSDDSTARLWDAHTGSPITLPLQHSGAVTHATFTPDGQEIMTYSNDQTIRVWRVGLSLHKSLPENYNIKQLTFSQDGQKVLISLTNNPEGMKTIVWDPSTGKEYYRADEDLDEVAFNPDGRRLWLNYRIRDSAPDTPGYELKSLDLETFELSSLFKNSGLPLGSPFTPDGLRFIDNSQDSRLELREVATGNVIGKPINPRLGQSCTSTNGEIFVTSDANNAIEAWSFSNGNKLSEPIVGVRPKDFFCSSDASRVGFVIGGVHELGTLTVWTPATGNTVEQALGFDTSLKAMSDDGKLMITASGANNSAQLWDSTIISPVGRALQHSSPVSVAAFSADGRLVVTGSEKTIQIWDASSGEPIGKALDQVEEVTHVIFDPTGRFLLTADRLEVRLYKFGAVETDAATLVAMIEKETGLLLDDSNGSIRALTQDEWVTRGTRY